MLLTDMFRRGIFVCLVLSICSIILKQFIPVIPPGVTTGIIIGASIGGAFSDFKSLKKKK